MVTLLFFIIYFLVMGCSAAKNLTVEPIDNQNNKVIDLANGHKDETRKISITQSINDVPPLESEDPQTEILENATVNNVQKGPNGLSFEIAFPENDDESIIKKHPPKRFQRLEEEQTSPKVSLVKLQEKLDEAEIRRQQILQQRIQSAKYRNNLKKQVSGGGDSDDEDIDHLKIPPDLSPLPNTFDVTHA